MHQWSVFVNNCLKYGIEGKAYQSKRFAGAVQVDLPVLVTVQLQSVGHGVEGL
jgi:hypothetical protein